MHSKLLTYNITALFKIKKENGGEKVDKTKKSIKYLVQGSSILSTCDLVLISQGGEYCTQNDALKTS